MFFKRSSDVQWLVVGLGNPGEEYEETRHNVGWMALDELAEEAEIPVQRLKHRALTGICTFGDATALLMKPVTYMNQSGEAVERASKFYNVPPEHVLVISDDISLPLGKLRVRQKGSDGGHNGLKSVIEHLGTNVFPRIRIGVGDRPDRDTDLIEWVLGGFSLEDRLIIDEACRQAAQAAIIYIEQGAERAMAAFN